MKSICIQIFLMYLMLLAMDKKGKVMCKISERYEEYNATQNEVDSTKPFQWFKGAQDMIASPAGHVVVQVAKELINRSAGNSQVLSLNLTNLFIILLLKILIFSAGLLGAGHWSNYGYGRSSDDNGIFSALGLNDGESYLITGFLAAQSGFDDCLYAAACASPTVAYEYARAAKALIEGLEKFSGEEYKNPRYNDLIVLVEQAAHTGYRAQPCNTTEICDGLL